MHAEGRRGIAGIINACDDKCSREGFAALSSAERTVCLVNWLRFEVCLGGLAAFYYNSASDFAPEMVWALNQIKAPLAAEALNEANARVQGHREAWPDGEARYEALRRVSDRQWRELENKLSSDSPRCYEALLEDFVEAHAAQLPPVGPHA